MEAKWWSRDRFWKSTASGDALPVWNSRIILVNTKVTNSRQSFGSYVSIAYDAIRVPYDALSKTFIILNAGAADISTVGRYAKLGLMLQPPAPDCIENEI